MPHSYDDATLNKVVERVEKGNDALFVAFDGDRIIAYWFLWWVDTPFPVLGIGILDEYQGSGLGRRLMRHLIETAENAKCDAIELTTALDNKPGQILYEKMGFKKNGTVDNLAGDGRVIKEWHMFYPLKPAVVPPPREHRAPV
jgi:ribosomal protein S18 acetylase RimI-like enzyme